MSIESSPTSEKYFTSLSKDADECYAIANKARETGFDPTDTSEIKKARDLAARVEAQVGPRGVAELIRNSLIFGTGSSLGQTIHFNKKLLS